MVYTKAENWPVLCYYDYDKMCKISSLFEIVNMGILATKICPKITFLGPGPSLGTTYLITVCRIQVKLVSTQTYLGKVLLQSIVAPLDFPLSKNMSEIETMFQFNIPIFTSFQKLPPPLSSTH